jgi:hypothetical protein
MKENKDKNYGSCFIQFEAKNVRVIAIIEIGMKCLQKHGLFLFLNGCLVITQFCASFAICFLFPLRSAFGFLIPSCWVNAQSVYVHQIIISSEQFLLSDLIFTFKWCGTVNYCNGSRWHGSVKSVRSLSQGSIVRILAQFKNSNSK